MSRLGVHWRIDGIPVAYIAPGSANRQHKVVIERTGVELADIEGINWAQPKVEHLTSAKEYGLPEGYGFELVRITYNSGNRVYLVEVQTASQYLGDVTGYQAQITELEAAAAEKDDTITAQAAQLTAAENDLAAANAQLAELEAAYDDN